MTRSFGRIAIPDNDDNSIDFLSIFRIFSRRFFVFVSVSIVVFSLVAIYTLQQVPVYAARTTIMIEPRQKDVADIQSVLSALPASSIGIDTQAQLIQSRSMAEKVVRALDLTNDPEFNWTLRPPPKPNPLTSWISSLLSSARPAQVAPPIQRSDEERQRRLMDGIVGGVLARTSVRRAGATYMIEITFQSTDREKAAVIVNEFADQYLLDQLEAKFEATARANDWLNDRLIVLREEVQNAENAVEQYRAQSGLLSARGSSLTEQQISDINAQLVIQRAEFEEASARLESVRTQISRGASADSIGEIFSSPLIRDLRTQQATINRERTELSGRYGERHPEIQRVEREAADIRAQIDQEINRIVSNLESEVDVARMRVSSLEDSLSRLRRELTQNNSSLVRLRELERNAEANRSLYESFLNRFKETGEQETLNEADARIVSIGVPGGKVAPNVIANLFVGLMLGCAAGVLVIGLLEIFDNGMRTGDQAEKQLNVPFLGYVPHYSQGIIAPIKSLTSGSTNVLSFVSSKPFSRFSESIRNLKSHVVFSNLDERAKIVAITSPAPKDGKTTTCLALGALSAISGTRSIVLDCDLRRRSLTKTVRKDKTVTKGLIELLAGEVPLESVIVQDEKSGLYILPLSDAKLVTQDVFGSRAFKQLLETLKQKYEFIVLDTAPVLAVTETKDIANLVDCVVLAVRWRKTSIKSTRAAIRYLESAKARLTGVTITQFQPSIANRMSDTYYSKTYGAYRKYYTN